MSLHLPGISTLGLGAAAAAVVMGWQQVKGGLNWVRSLLIQTTEITDEGRAVQAFFGQQGVRSPGGFRYYTTNTRFIRPLAQWGIVALETLGRHYQIFWVGRRPVWVRCDGWHYFTVMSIRGTINTDKLLKQISDFKTERAIRAAKEDITANRFMVHRKSGKSGKDLFPDLSALTKKDQETGGEQGQRDLHLDGRLIGWTRDDIGERIPATDPVDRLALSASALAAVEDIRRWAKSKEHYAERQLPWRIGVLLHGQPGTGKTSLAKAIAQHLNLPVYLMDIATMDNKEFHQAYHEALADAPAMVLIDDPDAVFSGRENIASEKGQGLTFDCLLNTISGIESSEGLLLIMATNHPDRLDPALMREGRVDRIVALDIPDEAGRRKMAQRILKDMAPPTSRPWFAPVRAIPAPPSRTAAPRQR